MRMTLIRLSIVAIVTMLMILAAKWVFIHALTFAFVFAFIADPLAVLRLLLQTVIRFSIVAIVVILVYLFKWPIATPILAGASLCGAIAAFIFESAILEIAHQPQ